MGAVRINAAQIGLDEQVGDGDGFVGGDPEPAEDAADGGGELGGMATVASVMGRDLRTSGTKPASRGDVAGDRDAVEDALAVGDVGDDRVLRAPVVPDDEVADLPAVPPRVLGAARFGVEVLEQRRALGFGPAVEANGVVAVDEQ